MYNGNIPVRYAKALFAYASGHGALDRAYGDAGVLGENFRRYPALRRVLSNRLLTNEKKTEVVLACCGEEPSAEFRKFVELVVEQNREEFLPEMCLIFREQVRRSENLMDAEVTTAAPTDDETLARLTARLEALTGGKVRLKMKVDPALIGGFVFRWDTYRLDASARGRLDKIKKSLTQKL